MSEQYNLVADQYDISFQLAPYRLHIEAYSLLKLVGDVTQLRVLDLATGTGFYARALKRKGAASVIGVDIAEQLVQIVLGAEEKEPLGITYHIQDVVNYRAEVPFDLAVAAYLLHYAPAPMILEAMCKAIAGNLLAGLRFVTYILNPDIARESGYYRQYGLNMRFANPVPVDGEAVPFTVTLGGMTTPEVTAYRWERTTVETALQGAGFADIRWVQPELSTDGLQQFGAEMFSTYLNTPHAVLLEATLRG